MIQYGELQTLEIIEGLNAETICVSNKGGYQGLKNNRSIYMISYRHI